MGYGTAGLPEGWAGRELGDDPYPVVGRAYPANAPHGRTRAPVSPSGGAGEDLGREAAFQARVIAAAQGYGWLVYHTFDSRRSAKGYPDLTMAHPDHGLIFAELKREGGKPSPEQEDWLATLRLAAHGDARVVVALWRPSDWDEVVRALRGGA